MSRDKQKAMRAFVGAKIGYGKSPNFREYTRYFEELDLQLLQDNQNLRKFLSVAKLD